MSKKHNKTGKNYNDYKKEVLDNHVKPASSKVEETTKEEEKEPAVVVDTTKRDMFESMKRHSTLLGKTSTNSLILFQRTCQERCMMKGEKDPDSVELENNIVDAMTPLIMARLAVEASQGGDKVAATLLLNKDLEASLRKSFASYGITLPPSHQLMDKDGNAVKGKKTITVKEQNFPKEIKDAAKKDLEAEKKVAEAEKKAPIDTVDPTKVKDADDLLLKLNTILYSSKEPTKDKDGKKISSPQRPGSADKVAEAIAFLKSVRMIEAGQDKEKIDILTKKSMGDWLKDLVALVGETLFLNGIGSSIVNTIVRTKSVIPGFLITKSSFGRKDYTDATIADLLGAIIEMKCHKLAEEALKYVDVLYDADEVATEDIKGKDGKVITAKGEILHKKGDVKIKDGALKNPAPTEQDITEYMANMACIKALSVDAKVVDDTMKNYKVVPEKKDGAREDLPVEVKTAKEIFSLMISDYFPGYKDKLNAGTFGEAEETIVKSKLTDIANLFRSIDERIESDTTEEGTSGFFINLLKRFKKNKKSK